jgi:predicted transporter
MEKVEVRAYNPSEPEQRGVAEIRRFTPPEIFRNVAKTLSIFWGIALFTVLIPGLHFVLTPSFFGIGIYLARKKQKTKMQIITGQVPCPKCKEAIKLKKADFSEGHSVICQLCVTSVKIILADS